MDAETPRADVRQRTPGEELPTIYTAAPSGDRARLGRSRLLEECEGLGLKPKGRSRLDEGGGVGGQGLNGNGNGGKKE